MFSNGWLSNDDTGLESRWHCLLGLGLFSYTNSHSFKTTQQQTLTRCSVWHLEVCVGMAMLCLLQPTPSNASQTDRQGAG